MSRSDISRPEPHLPLGTTAGATSGGMSGGRGLPLPLLLLLAAPLAGAPSATSSPGCDLNGEWNFAPIRGATRESSGWASWPFTYNISHDLATGAVSFAGFTTPPSVDITWRPSDTFSRATGVLLPTGELALTLHDVGRKAGVVANVSGFVHRSCDFVDMEGAPYACANAMGAGGVAQERQAWRSLWPAALLELGEADAAAAAAAAPEPWITAPKPNCSSITGPMCHTPRGERVKCPGCKGDVCGCAGATAVCKPCFKCTECAGVGPPAPPAPPLPPPPPPAAFVGGMFSRGGSPIDMLPSQWMRQANAWLLRAATVCSTDGRNVPLLTPGFPLGYVGQWMRDSYYGISSGIDLLPNLTATVSAVEWVFEHARPLDGAMPQSVDPHGDNDSFYEWGQRCNQTVGAPEWRSCIDLDSGPFAVKMADVLVSGMPTDAGEAFFLKWEAALANGLKVTTLDPDGSGLPWINSSRQLIGYGFQDGEYMSGDVLYSSILYWNATRILSDLYRDFGGGKYTTQATALRKQADHVRKQISSELWNEAKGAFVAATTLESDRISVWGNAFAGASGLANATQSAAIFAFFKEREKDIFWEGQVRQTPAPHFWRSTHTGPHTYQDGAFWGTPLHHTLEFIGRYDNEMACRLLHDSIASYRGHGIWEWAGPFYPAGITGAPGYVASAAGAYYGSKVLRCDEE